MSITYVEGAHRLSRDEAYMAMAHIQAKRSTCVRGQVGCVAVINNHIVAAGFNGAPAGMAHCLDVGCGGQEDGLFPNGCTRSVHAELNMVAFAARYGLSLDGCIVYATHGPCLPCAQALVSVGMHRMVYETPYRLAQGLELVDRANIPAEQWHGN